jgi:hypothetical protein
MPAPSFPKNIIVLNFSGHGSVTGDDTVLKNPHWRFDILLNVDDSGGHTGVLNSWLQQLNTEHNTISELFGIADFDAYNLPVGDFRTILSRWLSKDTHRAHATDISELLQTRVLIEPKNHDKKEITAHCQKLLAFATLEHESSRLDSYLHEYFSFIVSDAFQEYAAREAARGNQKIHHHSIGNIFVQFLLFLKDGSLFHFLQSIGWIPAHTFFQFIHPTRLELRGEYHAQNLEVVKIISEKDIDTCVIPLDNLSYIDPKKNRRFKTFSRPIRELLWNSDAIISFAGSPANRTPIFEHLQNTLSEYPGPILMIANAFVGAMDKPIHVQIQNIFDMGITPLVFTPAKNPIDYISDHENAFQFIQDYSNEGKTPFNTHNFYAWLGTFDYPEKIFPILDIHPATGLKYDVDQIRSLIEVCLQQTWYPPHR